MDRKFFKPIIKHIPIEYKSLNFAYKKHQPNKPRFEGTPQIHHSARVANYLANLLHEFNQDKKFVDKLNDNKIQKIIDVALLHDTLEDTETTYEELKATFGKETADNVMALTSPPNLSATGKKAEYLLNKMIKMSPDVLLIKLADRLDNINTLGAMPQHKIENTLNDTKYIIRGLMNSDRKLNILHKKIIKDITKSMERFNENSNTRDK